MTEAFPLAWPTGWKRTPRHKRAAGQFRGDADKIRQEMIWEIERLHGRYPLISSNMRLRRDGYPFAEDARKNLEDPGVAVYFQRNGKQMVFACDQYDAPWKNIRAITKTIEAIRGIERWGASDMLERSLSAFEALPAPKSWREVFGFLDIQKPSADTIHTVYRRIAMERHPDKGGSDGAMAELNAARDQALKEIGA